MEYLFWRVISAYQQSEDKSLIWGAIILGIVIAAGAIFTKGMPPSCICGL